MMAHGSPAFQPRPWRRRPPAALLRLLLLLPAGPAAAEPLVEQYGEVAIVEGSADLVASDDSGASIRYDARRKDPQAIARAFFTRYPDDYDALVVVTTFPDAGPNASQLDTLAYELSVRQEARGIGVRADRAGETFDDSADWGASRRRLAAFINMKGIADYPGYDGRRIDDPRSLFYPVLGHEFGHHWLAFARFTDAQGAVSARLLGRGGSHWSPLFQSGGSLLEGNRWVQRDDGSFDCVERSVRYGPLDLYLMGLAPPAAVPPLFVINDAVTDGGRRVDPLLDAALCEHVRGRREEVTLPQIVAALGPRQPAFPEAQRQFRMAFVVVTRPGERAADVLPLALQAERARALWEQRFREYTGGAGEVCTRLASPCGAPSARLLGGTLEETAGSDGDGVLEPGEPFSARFLVDNDGPVASPAITVTADSAQARFESPQVTLPPLAPGARTTCVFTGRLAEGAAACGAPLVVRAEARTGDGVFRGFASARVAERTLYRERFEDGAGRFATNADGEDTALVDGWAWGTPRGWGVGALVVQPDGGAGGSASAFFTGLARGTPQPGAWRSLSPGTSTITSPPLSLGGGRGRPRLRYAAWVMALDGPLGAGLDGGPRPVHGCLPGRPDACDGLSLYGRGALGRWYLLDQVRGAEARWRPREIDLADPRDGERGLDLSGPIELRFAATRATDGALVEVGVDELEIVADAPGCAAESGADAGVPDASVAPIRPFVDEGGCVVGRRGGGGGWSAGWCAVAALLALRRRRRAS